MASRDLEVEVFPSFLDTVNHDSSISFWNRHAMDCPALNRDFSNPVSDYFQFFSLVEIEAHRGSSQQCRPRGNVPQPFPLDLRLGVPLKRCCYDAASRRG